MGDGKLNGSRAMNGLASGRERGKNQFSSVTRCDRERRYDDKHRLSDITSVQSRRSLVSSRNLSPQRKRERLRDESKERLHKGLGMTGDRGRT